MNNNNIFSEKLFNIPVETSQHNIITTYYYPTTYVYI